MRRIYGCVALVAAAVAVCLTQVSPVGAHTAKSGRMRPHTTAPDVYVNVHVKMTDQKFTLSRHEGPRGADARFIIKNTSNKPHNFELGKDRPGLGLQSGFSTTVKPHKQKILILFLDYRGKIPYYGGLKSDRKKSGMRGEFNIGPCLKIEAQEVDGC